MRPYIQGRKEDVVLGLGGLVQLSAYALIILSMLCLLFFGGCVIGAFVRVLVLIQRSWPEPFSFWGDGLFKRFVVMGVAGLIVAGVLLGCVFGLTSVGR